MNSLELQDNIYRVVVPEQKVVEIKNGTKKERTKKMFPGYVLVEMVMSDEAWYIVRNTQGVTGFIGSSGKGAKPIPLLPHEVDSILGSMGLSRIDVSKVASAFGGGGHLQAAGCNIFGSYKTVMNKLVKNCRKVLC